MKEKYGRWYVIFPIVLFLIALSIRIIYLSEFSKKNPFFDTIPESFDHYNFDQAAINFSEGDLLARGPNNSFAPLYKYFLGFIYLLFGRNFYVIYTIQFAMGSIASVLIYLIAKDLFGFRAGLIAFFGFAIYSPQIIYEGIILRAAFISFWGIVSFYLLSQLIFSLTRGRLIVAALALSLFIQGRPNVILCLPFVSIFLYKIFDPLSPRKRTIYWLTFSSTIFLSFVPLLIQCYLVHGKFVFFDASGPIAFITGNISSYFGVGFDAAILEEYRKKNILGYLSNISFLFQHILEDFPAFVKLYLRKVYFLFNDFEAPSNISIYLYREFSNTLQILLGSFALFSSLGLIGMILMCKALSNKNRKQIFLLYSFMISLSLSVILFYNVSRLRIPIVPYFIIFSSYTVDLILTWIYKKEYKKVIVTTVAAIVLFTAFLEPKGLYRIRTDDYNNMAIAWNEKGQLKKAVTYLDKALDVDPLDFYSRFNKGQYYLSKQDLHNAIRNFEKAFSSNNRRTEAKDKLISVLFILGKQHLEKQEFKKAIDAYSKIQELDPQNIDALLNMGVCYASAGNNDRAKHLFESILKIVPDHSGAKTNLSLLY